MDIVFWVNVYICRVGDGRVASGGALEHTKLFLYACMCSLSFVFIVSIAKTDDKDSDVSKVSRAVVGCTCSYTLSF